MRVAEGGGGAAGRRARVGKQGCSSAGKFWAFWPLQGVPAREWEDLVQKGRIRGRASCPQLMLNARARNMSLVRFAPANSWFRFCLIVTTFSTKSALKANTVLAVSGTSTSSLPRATHSSPRHASHEQRQNRGWGAKHHTIPPELHRRPHRRRAEHAWSAWG